MVTHFINFILNFPVQPVDNAHLGDFWTLLVLLGWLYLVVVAGLLICLFGITIVRTLPLLVAGLVRRLNHRPQPPQVFLELAFPSDMSKSAYATEQLHVLLKGRPRNRSYLDTLAGHKKQYSLELVGTNDEGIRYVLVVPGDDVERIRHSLLSFLPAMKIREVPDYLTGLKARHIGVTDLKLAAEFTLPLKDHKALEEHDPFTYFAGHMTKLGRNELVAVQLVVAPVRPSTHMRVLWRARRMRNVIGSGKILGPELWSARFGVPRSVWICLLLPAWVAFGLLRLALAMVTAFVNPHSLDSPVTGNDDRRKPADLYEQELAGAVKAKLDQSLFEVSLRVLAAADNSETIARRSNALISAYHMFASPYQSFTIRRQVPLLRGRQWQLLQKHYWERHLTPNWLSYGSVVSSSELSDLYHFPNTDLTKTEGLIKSRSPELPAPLSIRRSDARLDVTLGVNTHGGQESPIGLTLGQRQKHTYIIGKTGTGKTTMLLNAIHQDMQNGKGLAVLDPHGDMFRELLRIVPEHRRNDVVVFDPSDREFPLGLNILSPGIPFADEEDAHEWITSTVLSVFTKLADEGQWGPRMEHILRNSTLTALSLPNPTLYTIQQLLTDKAYQKKIAAELKDPVLKQFWQKELALLGTMQLADFTAPLTHRLGRFITAKMSRRILLQPKSTVNVSDIMDEGKILLVNLSKGDIGEDQSFFFGTILTSLIWAAAYQRTKIPEWERRDFFLYVDEFQNFATPRFAEITSEGRKFHISLIVSHQNIAQIEDKNLVKVVAGNASTIVCLKASPDDEAFILPFMQPVVDRGDIVNLAPYHFFMRVATDTSEDAFSGQTVPLAAEGSAAARDAVVASSRERYTTPRTEVERQLEVLFSDKPAKPQGRSTEMEAI
jgi:hypothetical protein